MTSVGPWYQFPVTVPFGGEGGKEKGVDLKVPYGTPVTPLFPGTVSSVSYGPYGAEVNVTGNLNGQPVTAAYVHLDTVNVAQGQQVGDTALLGYSGGQLSGGYHNANSAYSSGPHMEFSLWPSGTNPYTGTPYDPMPFINAVQGGGYDPLTNTGTGSASLSGSPVSLSGLTDSLTAWLSGFQQGSNSTAQAASQSFGANQSINSQQLGYLGSSVAGGVSSGITNGFSTVIGGMGKTISGAFHTSSLIDLAWRVALITGGAIILLLVVNAWVGQGTRSATTAVVNSPPVQTARQIAGTAGAFAK